MQRKSIFPIGTAVAAVFLAGIAVGWLLAPAHESSPEPIHGATSPAPLLPKEAATIWTCSMHPQIRQPEPGLCPICAMELIPLHEEENGTDDHPRRFSMSENARALAEIQTVAVERRFPEAQIRLVGRIDYDETRVRSLTARFPARIDTLYVNYTGVGVNQGDHLARIYSPELLSAERELLTAREFGGGSGAKESLMTQSVREKLRLWDLLPDQIDEILARKQALDHFDLKAPLGGVVVIKNVREGDYVKTGDALFRIADLTGLWLWLDAYESDLAWLRYGQTLSFTVEGRPGETFEGRIAFIAPELDRKSRTAGVRVNVPNPDGHLKPGMLARGLVRTRMSTGGRVVAPELAGKWISPMHPEIVKDGPGKCDVCGMDLVPAESLGYTGGATDGDAAPLVVPSSAVLRTGKRAVVYVAVPDADKPSWDGREIVLGPRAGDDFIVAEGLREGERVVTKGAFKIDSALQIQAKPSMMSPDDGNAKSAGAGTVADGHSHEASPEPVGTPVPPLISLEMDMAVRLLPKYYDLQSALASDDLNGALAALRDMMAVTGHVGPLPDLIHAMIGAASLEEVRRPHFEAISNAFIAAVRTNPRAFQGDVWVMHCPMVYPDRGADWLQPAQPLRNPYYGMVMTGCGEVRENLTVAAGSPASSSEGGRP